ncbi:hypothetical protein BC835DRAFT_1309223 [Cytidiella melzeri]|nr:hypothetical protein BC835DRAFT_1309223 [Cytidiella melzeri]
MSPFSLESTSCEMSANDNASPEDVLSDSLQTLYDYTPITHSSAGAVFRRELVAARLLHMGIYVADHLPDLHLARHAEAATPTRVRLLELGAGAGLPGILIAKVYKDIDVTVSDYPDEELMRALAENIVRNGVEQRCRAVPYAWGSGPLTFRDVAAQSSTRVEDLTFDVVIAADTLWNSQLHSLFLDTLRKTLRKSVHSRIYLVAGLHTGRYTLQAFMRAVPKYELEFEEIEEREVGGNATRAWAVEPHVREDEKERRRWVVWMVLRWRSLQ